MPVNCVFVHWPVFSGTPLNHFTVFLGIPLCNFTVFFVYWPVFFPYHFTVFSGNPLCHFTVFFVYWYLSVPLSCVFGEPPYAISLCF
jgi:hypothetical protein